MKTLNILVCEGNTPEEGKKFKDVGIATHTESLKESLTYFRKDLNIEVLNPCLELDIDKIVTNLEKNKILNDEIYSDSKARMFLRRGYSLNKINQSLRNKGIEYKYIKQSIEKIKEDEIEPDFVSALKLCKRRRIGPLRPEANRELFYKKDMGILARGGFTFELSKRVLDLEKAEFNKLIKIV